MSSAKMTLIGLYQYLNGRGVDLFADFGNLPQGIDKSILEDNILLTGGEFEVMLSDPYFCKRAIGVWVNKWNRTFTKWVNALNITYNPLENYDRMEEWQDDETTSHDIVNSIADHKSNSSSGTSTDITSGSGTTENKVSAYNSDDYEPQSKSSTSNSTNGSTTLSNSATEDITTNGTTSDDGTLNHTRTGRAHGNIGVTTSQQMLQSELDIAVWNLYEHMTDLFLREFVIPIY